MKTIKEAAIDYATKKSSAAVFIDAHMVDFTAGVQFAETWIPVTEEPEKSFGFYLPILVMNEKYGLCSSAIFKDGKFIPDNIVLDSSEITHWRPINRK